MNILNYESLPMGGFGGLKEKRFVTDTRAFGSHKEPHAIEGLGNFVYLADANFFPRGQTGMHKHKEVDVISVMVEGQISHAGSLEHGQALTPGMVQVQRAGGEGFSHNEINPDDTENQMIQLWVLPEQRGEPAGYKTYLPATGERRAIYGGNPSQTERFHSHTMIDVAQLTPGQLLQQDGEVMLYLAQGQGIIGKTDIPARSLVHSENILFKALAESQVIVIYLNK